MLAKTPKEAVTAADDAFNSRDLEGVLALYEDGAIMVYEPGHLATGKAALRQVFESLLNLNAVAKQEKIDVVQAGDIALWTSKWSVSGTAQDGTPFTRGGFGSAILRKHSDGGWRVAVENPWGPAVLDVIESN
jgi:ketosteroid isomerase-like protein